MKSSTVFSGISSRLGYSLPQMNYPRLNRMDYLRDRIFAQDIQAFVEVIAYCRFLKEPENEFQQMINKMMNDLCVEGQRLIKQESENERQEIINYLKQYGKDKNA